MLPWSVACRLLSIPARRVGHYWDGYVTFEEDCEIAVVWYEHPEWGCRDDASPAEIAAFRADCEDALRRWFPGYLEQVGADETAKERIVAETAVQ